MIGHIKYLIANAHAINAFKQSFLKNIFSIGLISLDFGMKCITIPKDLIAMLIFPLKIFMGQRYGAYTPI